MPVKRMPLPKMPKMPTVEDALKRLRPKGVGAERRGRKRIGVAELNRLGFDGLGLTKADLERPDRRGTFTRIMDVLDIPRNAVANVIGSMAGVDKRKLRGGALGLKSVAMSDVLKKLGVRDKVVRGVVGFAGDVLADPLTYLSLGSTTGLKVAKHTPKLLKSGQRLLKTTARSAVSGRAVPKAVASALGRSPERLAKVGRFLTKRYNRQAAEKMLFSKRGGILSRAMASRTLDPRRAGAARRFFVKHGEKGRTVLRLPFAETGVSLPWGKRARLYKEFQKGGRSDFMRRLAGLQQSVRKGKVAVTKATRTIDAARMTRKQLKVHAKAAKKAYATYKRGYDAARRVGVDLPGVKHPLVRGGTGAKAPRLTVYPKPLAQYRTPAKLATLEHKARGPLLKKAIAAAKASAKAGKTAAKTGTAARGAMLASPNAPMAYRLAAKAKYGPSYLAQLPPNATYAQKLAHAAGRVKQRLFGHGASEMGRTIAGAKQRGTATAESVADLARVEFEKTVKPVIDRIVKATGRKPEDVASRLYDVLESGGKLNVARGGKGQAGRFAANDPVIRRMMEFRREMGRANRARVEKLATRVREFAESQRGELIKRHVGPGKVEDFLSRVPTEEFAKSAGQTEARLGRSAWTSPRVRRARYADPSGKVIETFTTADDYKRMERAAKAGEIEKLGEWGISAEQMNVWRRKGGPLSKLADPEFRGAQWQKSIPESVGQTARRTQQRLSAADIRDAAMQYGVKPQGDQLHTAEFRHMVPYERVQQEIRNTPFDAVVGPQLKGQAFPQPVADQMIAAARITREPAEMQGLARVLNYPMRIWKPLALAHPGYTIRNMFENTFGMAREGINPAKAVSHMPNIRRIVRTVNIGKDVAGQTVQIGGRAWDAADLIREARKYNMLNAGFTSQVLDPGMFNRTKGLVKKLGKHWFEFNNNIENTMRMSAWVTLMDEGMTARQAAIKTIRSMPDLTDLTLFERKVRNVVPWFAWLRKNTSNVAKLAFEKPALIPATEHARHAIELAVTGDKKIDPMLRPDWMDEQQAMQVAGDDKRGTVFLLASWLPFRDLMDIFSAADSPSHFARSVMSQIRPDVKVFAELSTGTDIFKNRPTEPFTTAELFGSPMVPQALAGQSGTVLDNLLQVRPLKEYGFRVWQQPTTAGKVARAAIGGAFQPLTRDRALYERYAMLRDRSTDLRRELNQAKAVNDTALVGRLLKEWLAVQREMRELGLPGVAKATQSRLDKIGVKPGEPAFAR